jgi:hypothetical protein
VKLEGRKEGKPTEEELMKATSSEKGVKRLEIIISIVSSHSIVTGTTHFSFANPYTFM